MSFSSSRISNSWRLRTKTLSILGVFALGCGSGHTVSTREVTTTTPQAAPANASAPPSANPIVESEQEIESPVTETNNDTHAEESAQRLEAKRAPARHSREKEGLANARQRDARSTGKSEPAAAMPTFAEPTFAEPPELSEVLNEFEMQATALSTNQTCDTACQALESMRRSAQKICVLVADSDPRARCSTARARVEQASRELSARCTTCR